MADVFTLFGRIAINATEANEQIDNVSEQAGSLKRRFESVGSSAVNVGKKIKNALVAAGVTKAVSALVKASVSGYAEYEQLVGGVETLFGTGGKSLEQYAEDTGKSVDEIEGKYNQLMSAQTTVFENAKKAYKTAGVSANEYMNMATSFAASLVSSLGGDTEAAAKLTELAILDMSDNANKMGTDLTSIQNAYQGFAKQNYTMLDNLKLGYGGTQSEMKRLLKDAQKLSGQKYNIKNLSDIIEAIHVIQDEMDITGTTQAEAAETISGSINATKAAWQNLVMGLADGNADIDQLFGDLTKSSLDVARNVGKVIPAILKNMGVLLQSAGKTLANGWENTVYPWIRDKFKIAFGIELPDWGTLKTTISTKWAEVQAAFEEGGLVKVFQVILPDWETTKTLISDGWKIIWAGIQGLFKIIFGVDIPSWEEIKGMISDGWNNVILPGIKDFFKVNFGVDLPSWESIKQSLSDTWDKIKNWWNGTVHSLGITTTIQHSGGGDYFEAPSEGGDIQNASGLRRVPYDGFKARLHENEAVLTASQAAIWRGERLPSLAGIGAMPVQTEQPMNLTINISGNTNSPYEVAQAVRNAVDDWRWRG